jgi:hypothetical protein
MTKKRRKFILDLQKNGFLFFRIRFFFKWVQKNSPPPSPVFFGVTILKLFETIFEVCCKEYEHLNLYHTIVHMIYIDVFFVSKKVLKSFEKSYKKRRKSYKKRKEKNKKN